MSKRGAERQIAGAALLFAALGDPTRLALVERLSNGGPASITALADRFDLTRQGISKHLQVLAGAGVIEGTRQGREHVWAINPARLAEARQRLELISRGWDSALARLKAHVEQA
jgi:DNA-binding transcriptional ArsR family regulator